VAAKKLNGQGTAEAKACGDCYSRVALENPLLIAPGLFAVFLAALGLVVGSFLNVVIARVPMEQSIVHPRSRCPKCGHAITWYENIPVLSWLWLRGRCSHCKAPISVRYPLIELLTGVLFLACLRRLGWEYPLVPALILVTLLVPLTFIDLEHWLLPFELTLPGIVLGIATAIPMGSTRVRDAALGVGFAFLGLWFTEKLGARLFKREAMGGGDKWLLALIGAFLTWRAVMLVLILASIQGAVVGILLILFQGRAGPAPKPKASLAPGEPSAPTPPTVAPATETPPTETSPAAAPPMETPPAAAPPAVGATAMMPAEVAPPTARLPVEEANATSHGPAAQSQAALAPPSPKNPQDFEDDWVPGPTAIPFGPWLALAALEVLLAGPLLAQFLPETVSWMFAGDPF